MMIIIPKWSQVHIGMLAWGAVGFVAGQVGQVDSKLTTLVFAISSLANDLLFFAAKDILKKPVSLKALYVGTNTLVSTVAIFAARHLELISRRTVCGLVFANSLLLAARLRMLYTEKLP